jgi:hypothetical protein
VTDRRPTIGLDPDALEVDLREEVDEAAIHFEPPGEEAAGVVAPPSAKGTPRCSSPPLAEFACAAISRPDRLPGV